MSERRRLQPELRRQQILEAAVHLFYEVGFEAASLRDLASRVGINKATIYHYFASKEEILAHIVGQVGDELLGGVRSAAGKPGLAVEVLEQMVRFQIGYLESTTWRRSRSSPSLKAVPCSPSTQGVSELRGGETGRLYRAWRVT